MDAYDFFILEFAPHCRTFLPNLNHFERRRYSAEGSDGALNDRRVLDSHGGRDPGPRTFRLVIPSPVTSSGAPTNVCQRPTVLLTILYDAAASRMATIDKTTGNAPNQHVGTCGVLVACTRFLLLQWQQTKPRRLCIVEWCRSGRG